MKILLILCFLLLPAMPAMAQSDAPQQQAQEEGFSKEMARMMIAMFERALVEMKKSMLDEAPAAPKTNCDCSCPPVPEANT